MVNIFNRKGNLIDNMKYYVFRRNTPQAFINLLQCDKNIYKSVIKNDKKNALFMN